MFLSSANFTLTITQLLTSLVHVHMACQKYINTYFLELQGQFSMQIFILFTVFISVFFATVGGVMRKRDDSLLPQGRFCL